MKFTKLFLIFFSVLLFMACNKDKKNKSEVSDNPFLNEYNTTFDVPPFDKIKNEHYVPAIEEGIKKQKEEIEAIVNNSDEPDFENTLVAYDNSGILLNEVYGVFSNVNESNTSDSLQEIAKAIAPLVTKHGDDVYLNEKLFARIKVVYDKKDNLNLNAEQLKLLETVYNDFVWNGANIAPENKERFRQINEELSLLTIQFDQNVLAETNNFKLIIDNEKDLAGLPEQSIQTAAQKATADSLEGKWVFTVQKSSMIPFLQYCQNRELRKKLMTAYNNLGNNDNEFDNKETINKIVNLRLEKANLLGYNNFSEYRLSDNMAKTPDKVYELLNKLWTPAVAIAKEEAAELQKLINKEGGKFKLEPWDWEYYTDKLKTEKFDLNDEMLKPYFTLDNVIDGAFTVANKLYGLTFEKLENMPVYHPDVVVYEVKDKDGSHLGLIYADFYSRDTKGSGAWMDSFRKQSRQNDEEISPIITMNTNFAKPSDEVPSLLSFDEVETLFHEFGHVLHGLLSDCTYYKLSGTSVARDFVELPSQIMENWASEPEVLKLYAKHYQTGEVLPQELLDKIIESSKFNQGFTTVEYLSAAILDLDWHTVNQIADIDVNQFEKNALDKMGLIPEIVVRYRSTYFKHIFSSSYASGYYSYIWAEVIEADTYSAFQEKGIFDPATAQSLRDNILSKGGTIDPMQMFINFRGREPEISALLKRRGLEG